MGLTCSSATQGLAFHPYTKGHNIQLSSCLHQAKRGHSFHDGIIFSNRPLLPKEKVWIRILEAERRWHGALRVGFTSVDPNSIESTNLPPFACPNLTNSPDFWAMGIADELCMEGEEICFWVNKKGQALVKKRGRFKPKVLFSGIPRKKALWVMIDVYGQTKAVQLLDSKTKRLFTPCCSPDNKEPPNLASDHSGTTVKKNQYLPSPQFKQHMAKPTKLDPRLETVNLLPFREDDTYCVICQDRTADTLLLPCRHCSFCQQCVLKIRGQNNICPLCRQSIFITKSVTDGHLPTSYGS
ncbi:E3 ubiquitin-protein ligase NEURL3 [Hyla sarda]|uniref:E3 ubiquitin-protein ligase NEURL3 n=1 Tax=Hyla sarda TaxID=327740 RepID=UPI0024C3E7AC|nr:E3 ubiquitin-protein ligase NEURL3 [Hyla sarda]